MGICSIVCFSPISEVPVALVQCISQCPSVNSCAFSICEHVEKYWMLLTLEYLKCWFQCSQQEQQLHCTIHPLISFNYVKFSEFLPMGEKCGFVCPSIVRLIFLFVETKGKKWKTLSYWFTVKVQRTWNEYYISYFLPFET